VQAHVRCTNCRLLQQLLSSLGLPRKAILLLDNSLPSYYARVVHTSLRP
jgi:hypothetical protein